MSLTSLISQNENNCKLAQKLVHELSQKFSLNEGDCWTAVCNKPYEMVVRRIRRNHRKNDPLSAVKKPRTAFSFFTQDNREKIRAANPAATFGDVARLVSKAWGALSAEQLASYKDREATDKRRYRTELDAAKANLSTHVDASASASAVPAADASAAPAKAPKAKSSKTAAAPAADASAAPAKAPKAKTPKTASAKSDASAAPTASAAPAADAAPAAAHGPSWRSRMETSSSPNLSGHRRSPSLSSSRTHVYAHTNAVYEITYV
jgi:hypothetical protein